MVGSVVFIGTLLTMAGVELNPGPADTFIYRYQYLLIEIGTDVMRKLFDSIVANDLMQYLKANPVQYNQLLFLMTKNIITDSQKKLLPPVDSKPTSANFDITLLACLLRNICGLRTQTDLVWKSPVPGDVSLEADIARLRDCRNNLSHIGTVYISEQDLAVKWNDLSKILMRLNSNGGIKDLTKLIDDAQHMSIDGDLEQRHREAINAWVEMDKHFDDKIEEFASHLSEIKDEQSKLKDCQSQLTHDLSVRTSVQRDQSDRIQNLYNGQEEAEKRVKRIENTLQMHVHTKLEKETDFKNHLIKIYQKSCCTLPLSALCCEGDDEMDLLSIYKPPTMFHEPYHRSQTKVERYSITSYQKVFCKGDHMFRNIYITGDAGIGKTSLCKCMCNIWCMSKSGGKVKNIIMQKDIEFMKIFEFVFYISLRESDKDNVIDMIVDQLFCTTSKDKREDTTKAIEYIIQQNKCLIIMDGLDELTLKSSDKNTCLLPKTIHSDKCICLTTCRPFIIETIRLSRNDIDHQVHMTGIHGNSSKDYVKELVTHVNNISGKNKTVVDFMRETSECGLDDQLNIPIIVSQLIAVWFDRKLTDMSRAQIYSNIIEMLFKRAEKSKLEIPITTPSTVQLPDSMSEFYHLEKHFPILEELCLLSFRSLFKLDRCIAVLVFTKEHLMKEPYGFSPCKIDFLCKIGILSKNKIIGQFGRQEHKLSFLHKSHMEFLAALFVCSFDKTNLFGHVLREWNTLEDVLQYQNFLLLLAGLSYQKVTSVFETIYVTLADELILCRRNGIFQHGNALVHNAYTSQLKSLQNIVVHCFQEVGASDAKLKLEDYIFEDDTSDVEILKKLLFVNRECVMSIYSVTGKYFDVFDQIKELHCLRIGKVLSSEYTRFLLCMLQNPLTLHTVCIVGGYALVPELPIKSVHHKKKTLLLRCVKMQHDSTPHHLTSLSLRNVTLHHHNLHILVKYLSSNVLMENIKLYSVSCDNHEDKDGRCTLVLNLQNHTKLTILCLYIVNIQCYNINSSRLQSLEMFPLSENIVLSCYTGVFDCVTGSQLEHICIYGSYWYRLDSGTISKLLCTVKTLACIKSLELWSMILPDDVLLQLNPGVKQVDVKLYRVTFSRSCFHHFIESFVENKHATKGEFDECTITLGSGTASQKLTYKESVDYMSEYLTPICNEHINIEGDRLIGFETCSG